MKGHSARLVLVLGLMGLGNPRPVQEVPDQSAKLDIVPVAAGEMDLTVTLRRPASLIEEVQFESPDGKGFEEVRILSQNLRHRRSFRRDPTFGRIKVVEETMEVADQFVVRFENYLTDEQVLEMVSSLGMRVEKKLTAQTYVISFNGSGTEESFVAQAKIHSEMPVQTIEPIILFQKNSRLSQSPFPENSKE